MSWSVDKEVTPGFSDSCLQRAQCRWLDLELLSLNISQKTKFSSPLPLPRPCLFLKLLRNLKSWIWRWWSLMPLWRRRMQGVEESPLQSGVCVCVRERDPFKKGLFFFLSRSIYYLFFCSRFLFFSVLEQQKKISRDPGRCERSMC